MLAAAGSRRGAPKLEDVKSGTRQVVLYSVVRLGTFAAALAILLLLQVEPWIAAIAAAIIGLCVCYVLLPRQRAVVVQAVADIRTRADKDDDNDLENEALDRL